MAHRDGPPYPSNSQFIDLFQHLLDEINRTRDYAEATSDYNMMQAARRDGRGQD